MGRPFTPSAEDHGSNPDQVKSKTNICTSCVASLVSQLMARAGLVALAYCQFKVTWWVTSKKNYLLGTLVCWDLKTWLESNYNRSDNHCRTSLH